MAKPDKALPRPLCHDKAEIIWQIVGDGAEQVFVLLCMKPQPVDHGKFSELAFDLVVSAGYDMQIMSRLLIHRLVFVTDLLGIERADVAGGLPAKDFIKDIILNAQVSTWPKLISWCVLRQSLS